MISFERDKKMASIFLISLMNLRQATIEKEIYVNMTTQVVLSKLAQFNDLDRGVDSESKSHELLFRSFFNKVFRERKLKFFQSKCLKSLQI